MRPEREAAESMVLAYTQISLERGGFAGGAAHALEPDEAERWIKIKERERQREYERGR